MVGREFQFRFRPVVPTETKRKIIRNVLNYFLILCGRLD